MDAAEGEQVLSQLLTQQWNAKRGHQNVADSCLHVFGFWNLACAEDHELALQIVLHTLLLCNLRKRSCLCRPYLHHLQLCPKHQLQHQSPKLKLQILDCMILLIKTNIVFSFSSSIVLLMWIKKYWYLPVNFPFWVMDWYNVYRHIILFTYVYILEICGI